MKEGRIFFKQKYTEWDMQTPEYHFVLGSGFSPSVSSLKKLPSFKNWEERGQILFKELVHLKIPTVKTHEGVYRYFVHKNTGRSICFQCGRLHGYEGYKAKEVALTVTDPFLAGTHKFILTNIAGSLTKDLPVSSVAIITDHVNFTGQNPLVGKNPCDEKGQELGPRFPVMDRVYDKKMAKEIAKELADQNIHTEEGVYVGVLGPSLETVAEIQFFSQQGWSVVGMSTVWESIALNHMGAEVSAFSLISNSACGMGAKEELNHENMMKVVSTKSEKMLESFLNYCHKKWT